MNAHTRGVAAPHDLAARRVRRTWSAWTLATLVALLPLSFSIETRIKALPVALLFFCGLALLRHEAVRRDYRAAAPVMVAALLLIGLDIVNVLWHGLGWRPLDHAAHVLLYVVVAAAFGRRLRMELVWSGFSLTAIVLGAACLVQHYMLGVPRAYGLNGGGSSAIECATLLLGLALLALVRLLHARPLGWRWWLHGAGMAFGMYGALLTQSRGPLLAFVPAFLLVLLVQARRSGHWRWSLALGAAVCLGGAVATATLHGAMLARFTSIQQEVAGFDRGDPDGSIGERLEMWRTALRAFAEHPLAGVGVDRYADYARAEIAAGRSDPAIARYNQPHNEYLRALATGGLPMLLLVLAVFGLALRHFARWLDHPDEAVASTATAGLAIVVLYLLCALGESVFYRVMSQSFFFFLVLGLALRVGSLAVASAAAPTDGTQGPTTTPRLRRMAAATLPDHPMARRYLLFAELSYAFEILRPLQEAAWRRGAEVAWFLHGPEPAQLRPGEQLLRTVAEVQAFAPDAVFVPGNEVPPFFPGLKVQVFHGLGIEKKGHFRIRGMFDLFCTFGPLTTGPFERLAAQHGWFKVVETGWPKLDPLFASAPAATQAADGARILYAPTFSPSLTSAPLLAATIADLVARRPWQWTVKFHPKMDASFAAPLRAIRSDRFRIEQGQQLLPLLREADVLLTDTSSAAAEFMLLDKPVVAFRNRAPGPHLINVTEPDTLEPALEAALAGRDDSMAARERYAMDMHPYRDGRSSERVLDAAEAMLERPPADLRRKPFSPLRRFRYRRALR